MHIDTVFRLICDALQTEGLEQKLAGRFCVSLMHAKKVVIL